MLACLPVLALGLFVPETACQGTAKSLIGISITVSPSTIVLGCDKGDRVTVHTDMPLSEVDRESLALSGVAPITVKSDSRGNLVAKFDQEAIEVIVAPPQATLVLTGTTTDGDYFQGSDVVRVIEDPSPRG
jgi:hypothetical protein